jgi:signal transduction histidine kinase
MGHVLVARDVTERRRAERLMKEQEAQLIQAQKMEAVGRLAGGVAHDFNNLLMVVLGNSQLLLAGMRSDDPNRCLVEEILQAGEKGAALNRQILTFSRRQVLEAQSVLLDDVVAGLEPLLRRIVGSGIELVFHLAAGPTPVEIDPPQMEQAILNLAINARDAMPSGGRLTIETLTASCEPPAGAEPSPAATEGDVLLRVTDTGTGMDEQTMAHIFEPFFTTKDPGQGTGLGLSTVFGIVKQSGGTISVASEPGWGTRFEICLPAGTPKDREESPGAEVAKTPEQPPYVVVEA